MSLYRYINQILDVLLHGKPPASVLSPELPITFTRRVSQQLGMVYLPQGSLTSNVCLANVEEVRPAFRSSFTAGELLDYIYAAIQMMPITEKALVQDESLLKLVPKGDFLFWKWVALGSKIKEVHLSSSIGVDPQLFSFLEEGDNRVQTPAYRLDAANVLSPSSCPEGKVYINSRQYFGFVPEAVWRYKLLDVQPAHVWLTQRRGQQLSPEDILHYQKVLTKIYDTNKLMQQDRLQ